MKEIHAILIAIGFIIVISFASVTVFAQISNIDKTFVKDFCSSENNLLDDLRYRTGEELSFTSSDCPISVKTIHRWNDLSILEQTTITSRLTSLGYVAK